VGVPLPANDGRPQKLSQGDFCRERQRAMSDKRFLYQRFMIVYSEPYSESRQHKRHGGWQHINVWNSDPASYFLSAMNVQGIFVQAHHAKETIVHVEKMSVRIFDDFDFRGCGFGPDSMERPLRRRQFRRRSWQIYRQHEFGVCSQFQRLFCS
jgi:hypothetical protein